jgi:hypothetical protein
VSYWRGLGCSQWRANLSIAGPFFDLPEQMETLVATIELDWPEAMVADAQRRLSRLIRVLRHGQKPERGATFEGFMPQPSGGASWAQRAGCGQRIGHRDTLGRPRHPNHLPDHPPAALGNRLGDRWDSVRGNPVDSPYPA